MIKNLFNQYDLHKIILFIVATTFGIIFIASIGKQMFGEKTLKQYYLSGGESGQAWKIKLDIDNYTDDTILINGMTYDQAIEYVIKLNKSIGK